MLVREYCHADSDHLDPEERVVVGLGAVTDETGRSFEAAEQAIFHERCWPAEDPAWQEQFRGRLRDFRSVAK